MPPQISTSIAPQPIAPDPTSGGAPKIPLALIALITLSGTLAMHIFVPALPSAARDLHASLPQIQMTISLYILGLAFGQLVYGPLSDRFGRRPTLMAGLVVYVLASVAAFLAPRLDLLVVARLAQAFGGCAGLVIGRAVVRDTAGGFDAARRLALLNLMVSIGPGLAPLVGGVIAETLGWRAIFLALTALGLVNAFAVWRLLPETRPPQAENRTGTDVARAYLRLARNPAFLGYAMGGACATTSLYAFVAAAPFIVTHELHRSTHEIGPFMSVLVLGVGVGSIVANRFVGRVPMRAFLVSANALSVAAGALYLIAALSGGLTLIETIVLMLIYTIGAGTASPAALTQAISIDPEAVGSASGLYGFAQMIVGAICAALVGFGPSPSIAAGIVVFAAGLTAQFAFWIALRGRGAQTP